MGPESILILLFVAKHLIFDWWLQPTWMAFSKHDLTKPGGYIHAGLNVVGTFCAFGGFILIAPYFNLNFIVTSYLTLWLIIGEFVSHYLMDFVKMNVTRKMGWKCNEHVAFWHWTGFDQWFHMTYLVIMAGILV